MLAKERFLNACYGLPVDHPPVWMMRQAGRTLKEYRDLREKHSFWEICKSPELAASVTLQPLNRFKVDAAIIFSDILVIPNAMGMEVSFSPKLSLLPKIQTVSDIKNLKTPNIRKELFYVSETIREVVKRTKDSVAVIGFSGAPFTLVCYMIEGASSTSFQLARQVMHKDPLFFNNLMDMVSSIVIDYLLMQIESGPTVVQLFDTWAGELTPDDYQRFILPYLIKIIEAIKPTKVPVIYYINGVGNLLPYVAECGADVLGIDWRIALSSVREKIGYKKSVQGNLDPTLLFASKNLIQLRIKEMIDQTNGLGHIVNLGHGLLPDTPIEGIQAFVDAVKNWTKPNKKIK